MACSFWVGFVWLFLFPGFHPLESPFLGVKMWRFFFFPPNQEIRANLSPSPKFNSEFTPEKMVVGRRSFPIGKVTSQGRTVKLWEGKWAFEVTCASLSWQAAYNSTLAIDSHSVGSFNP